MDLYEVHVPCGKKVLVVCKEEGDEVKVLKNGNVISQEQNKPNRKNETVEKVSLDNSESTPPDVSANSTKETPDSAPDEEDSVPIEEKPNMAGGKKSRRNNARKNNATRKNQAGGKKRGPNDYMKFANKVRPQILKEHPELKSDVVGVARKIGEKWRSLSAAEKAKY